MQIVKRTLICNLYQGFTVKILSLILTLVQFITSTRNLGVTIFGRVLSQPRFSFTYLLKSNHMSVPPECFVNMYIGEAKNRCPLS